jgi:hypothetical protein
MKNTLIGILVVVVIALGAYTINQRRAVAPTQNNPITATAASHCGLTVNSPLPNTVVTFPLSLNVTVDNTQAAALGCSWTVFEAQSGTVTIKDVSGTTLAQTFLSTTADWMTVNPTAYTTTIASISNPSYTGPLTLTFEEENPSGEGTPDTLVVGVMK